MTMFTLQAPYQMKIFYAKPCFADWRWVCISTCFFSFFNSVVYIYYIYIFIDIHICIYIYICTYLCIYIHLIFGIFMLTDTVIEKNAGFARW